MSCCTHCRDAGEFFDLKNARKELRRYQRKGPLKSTRLLLDAVKEHNLSGKTLLDIGGGVGMIQQELLGEGISQALQVDASQSYLDVAAEEAEKQGYRELTSYQYGDFVDVANEIPEMDIVTLDRVICCYPHMERLVEASVEKTKKWYAVVYPKDHVLMKLGLIPVNTYFRIRGIDFRVYIHCNQAIRTKIKKHGFDPIYQDKTMLWNVEVYERNW